MKHKAIQTVARLRRLALDDASQALSRALAAETTAAARAVLALYAEMADLVRLGAYRAGSDPAVDEAILLAPRIEAVLRQDRDEHTGLDETFALLRAAMETTDAA